MPLKDNDIELRSDEVQDILTEVPNWMIRWGNTLFLCLILMLLFLAWLIKYPEVVSARATITTEQPPIYIVNKVSGRIDQLVQDSIIKKGDFIIEIQNPTNQANIQELENQINIANEILTSKNRYKKLKEDEFVLGDAQAEYSRLSSYIKEYQNFLNDPYYSNKISDLNIQIKNYKRYENIYETEQDFTEEDLVLAKEKIEMHRRLFNEELISRKELIDLESSYKQLLKAKENSKRSNVQNDITLVEYERQIKDLQFDQRQKNNQLRTEIEQSIQNIDNLISSWNQTYTIDAPIGGKLKQLDRIKEGEFVQAGDTILVVIPETSQYLLELEIPANGFGKIIEGQEVQIEFAHFPSQEYGKLSGKLTEISNVAKRNTYFAKATLNNQLYTTYNKEIEYNPDMVGNARIITEDLSLLDRIFNNFRELVLN